MHLDTHDVQIYRKNKTKNGLKFRMERVIIKFDLSEDKTNGTDFFFCVGKIKITPNFREE